MNLTIDFETLYEGEQAADVQSLDLANGRMQYAVIVGFGNGIYDEARVVGHTKEAALYFIRLIQAGGYAQAAPDLGAPRKRLYRAGDACFPESDPFIFVAPETRSGEALDFRDLDAEFQRCAAMLEAAFPSEKAAPPAPAVPDARPPAKADEKPTPRRQWWKFW